MKDLLVREYGIHTTGKELIGMVEGLKNNEYVYVTIPVKNKEIMYMEQAALSYYLYENGYVQTACPIPNLSGDWFTNDDDQNYIVVKLSRNLSTNERSHGQRMANFHQLGAHYRYEPRYLSSYGQWYSLWIDKLEWFEYKLTEQTKQTPHPYHQLFTDMLPYMIGISENAIQYIRESEQERRYHEGDRGTIAFRRYTNHLIEPVIWFNDLVYDHPARDLAEFIRNRFLHVDEGEEEIALFLEDYQTEMPISVFGWRQIYARLIFPIHLFDVLESGFVTGDYDEQYERLMNMLAKQEVYEKRLGRVFEIFAIDHDALHIPVLHWLN